MAPQREEREHGVGRETGWEKFRLGSADELYRSASIARSICQYLCMHVPDLQNEAKIAYAKYLLKFEPGLEGMLSAASILQECFESGPAGSEFSIESASLGRPTITEIRQTLPTLINNRKLAEAAVVVSTYALAV